MVIRHPMPYGNLSEQKVQRFATLDDMKRHKCTIEEMEEYEPHIDEGFVVYAGVDYAAILAQAEKEADVDSLGRREQRPSVLRAGPAHHRGRIRTGPATSSPISPAA